MSIFEAEPGTREYKIEWVNYQMWLRGKICLDSDDEKVAIYDRSHAKTSEPLIRRK
jgi:hypothetical protein